jgi:predicted transcriptional regulator
LKPRGEPRDIYNQSGVYQLQCSECPLKYIGQTGRTFNVRYREHINAIRTNRQNSKFPQHILETGHNYDTIDKTMKMLHMEKKGPKLNTLERFHIYDITKKGLQMNDTFTDIYNPVFDIVT